MFGFSLLLATTFAAAAPTCPKVSVYAYSLVPGKAVFEAWVGAGIRTYKWTASSGKIVSGQGTDRIEVTGTAGEQTTATLEVGPVAKGCATSDYRTLTFADGTMGSCPKLIIRGSPNKQSGRTNLFTGYMPAYPGTFYWTVSDGGLVEGQGTDKVVHQAEVGHTVTVTVQAKAEPSACSYTDSVTFDVE